MKPLLSLLACVALPVSLLAQPVIDESFTPQLGEVFSYTSGDHVPITLAGENVVWDLSGLTAGAGYTLTCNDPTSTGYADLYPTAGLVIDGDNFIQFMRADTSGLYIVGTYRDLGSQAIQIHFTNESLFLPFPCTYNTAFVDSFTYAYGYTGGTANGGGNGSYVADGFGTLVLPYDTIYNVLKLTGTQISSESIPGTSVATVSHQVYFFKPGVHYYLLSSTEVSQSINGGTPQTGNGLYYLSESFFAQVGEQARQQIGIDAWPVPARDELNVTYALAGGHQVDVVLFDAIGRPIRSLHQRIGTSGIQRTAFDVKGLPAGIYLLKVTDDHGQRGTRTVVID